MLPTANRPPAVTSSIRPRRNIKKTHSSDQLMNIPTERSRSGSDIPVQKSMSEQPTHFVKLGTFEEYYLDQHGTPEQEEEKKRQEVIRSLFIFFIYFYLYQRIFVITFHLNI